MRTPQANLPEKTAGRVAPLPLDRQLQRSQADARLLSDSLHPYRLAAVSLHVVLGIADLTHRRGLRPAIQQMKVRMRMPGEQRGENQVLNLLKDGRAGKKRVGLV